MQIRNLAPFFTFVTGDAGLIKSNYELRLPKDIYSPFTEGSIAVMVNGRNNTLQTRMQTI